MKKAPRGGLLFRNDLTPSSSARPSFTSTPRRPTTGITASWANATPRVTPTTYAEAPPSPTGEETTQDFADWEAEQKQVDRDWYDVDESGAFDDEHNPFADYMDVEYLQKKEDVLKKQQLQKKMSARAQQYHQDNE
ncbi:MAG: hypothetical protein BJ554DRAFT_1902, partial [Olpidium bornovanus]